MQLSTSFLLIISIISIKATPPRISDGIVRVTSHFYNQIATQKLGKNIIISPLSIFNALALLSLGANGNTLEQLKQGIWLGPDKQITANLFEGYYRYLNQAVGSSEFSIANAIYVQTCYGLNADFKRMAVDQLKSDAEELNFVDVEESARTINEYVEQKTRNKIHDLITPQMLSDDTRLVLVNAIYFKGDWLHPFKKANTYRGQFSTSNGKAPVDFMNQINSFNYGVVSDLDAIAIEMSYANSNVTFVVVLPNTQTGLRAIQQKVVNYGTYEWSRIYNNMQEQRVNVTIPKFKSEFSMILNDVLKNLNMGDMFTDASDLSGLVENVPHLQVDAVVHKAFVSIYETGTEIAAATGITGLGGAAPPSAPIEFLCDRPFLYFIRELINPSIMFVGSFEKPE